MNDTPDVIAEIMRKKFMQKNQEERMLMGFSMFDSAKAIMLASRQNLSITEKRKMIFLRFYGNEFDHPTIKKVLAHLDSLSI
jgi:predicted transcriptional regulator